MPVDLTTTNVLLGILATVSVLEVLAVVGLFAGGYLLFRRLMKLLTEIEQRQVAPAAARVNEILDDLKTVTRAAKRAAESADRMAGWWRGFRGA
jgi:pyrimidine operon attenuation protein/uracil phosphoribosyltransferase